MITLSFFKLQGVSARSAWLHLPKFRFDANSTQVIAVWIHEKRRKTCNFVDFIVLTNFQWSNLLYSICDISQMMQSFSRFCVKKGSRQFFGTV